MSAGTIIALLVGIVSVCIAMGATYIAFRAKGGEVWKTVADGYRAKVDQQQTTIDVLTEQNTELKSQPDITRMYDLLLRHDERSAQVAEQMVQTLKEIRDVMRREHP